MADEERLNAGETIVEQGATSTELFVLKNGSVGVYVDDTLIEAFNAKDTVIGEMSVILDRPRTATVKARSSCTIVRYEAKDMSNLIGEHPDVAELIFKSLASRLDKANHKIADLTEEKNRNLWED